MTHPSINPRAAAADHIALRLALRRRNMPSDAGLDELLGRVYVDGVDDGRRIAHDEIAAPSSPPEVERPAARRVTSCTRRAAIFAAVLALVWWMR